MTARATVAAMTAYALEFRQAGIKLNQNESPHDLPAELKREILDSALERRWNVYPDFESLALREALAEAHGLAPEEVLAGNGSNELLAAAIGAVVGPGTPVVFSRPTFALYEKLVTIAGGLPVAVPLDPESGLLPLDRMVQALEPLRGAVAIVCSPNNPTGGILPEGGIRRLLATGATVLYDRAYGDFAGDGIPALHDRLLTFSTLSKAWGLAGLRVGWLASTGPTCRQVRKVKLPYSLNFLSESAAISLLRRPGLRDATVACVTAERARVSLAMRQLPGVRVFPSFANFIAFRPERVAAPELFELLCARGILIRDLSSYPGLSGCLRVSLGTREDNDAFLSALEELA